MNNVFLGLFYLYVYYCSNKYITIYLLQAFFFIFSSAILQKICHIHYIHLVHEL